jgi:8-hydroxy-5-deazaflavin:NADPH oxidoreductase
LILISTEQLKEDLMNIAIFGTGSVGRTLAESIATHGHNVVIGTRNPADTLARTETDAMGTGPFAPWQADHTNIALKTFADAAADAEVIVLATNGNGTLASLEAAGVANIGNKIVIDVSNALDFSQGMPPSLFVSNTDSMGETVQRGFPEARVVKTLNTMAAAVMVNPSAVANGQHNVFLSGNNAEAKGAVSQYLQDWFGWTADSVIDLGDITTSRGTEMYFGLWIRTFMSTGNPMFNISIAR